MGEDYEWVRYTFDTHNKAGFPLCTWQTFPWLTHDGAWKRIFDVKKFQYGARESETCTIPEVRFN